MYPKENVLHNITMEIVNFFDELGVIVADAQDESKHFITSEINPIYVESMLRLGLVCTELHGKFNSGKSMDVYERLTGKRKLVFYKTYFILVYNALVNQMENSDDWYIWTPNTRAEKDYMLNVDFE